LRAHIWDFECGRTEGRTYANVRISLPNTEGRLKVILQCALESSTETAAQRNIRYVTSTAADGPKDNTLHVDLKALAARMLGVRLSVEGGTHSRAGGPLCASARCPTSRRPPGPPGSIWPDCRDDIAALCDTPRSHSASSIRHIHSSLFRHFSFALENRPLSNRIRCVIFLTPRAGTSIATWRVRRGEFGDSKRTADYRHAISREWPPERTTYRYILHTGCSDGRRRPKNITRATCASQ